MPDFKSTRKGVRVRLDAAETDVIRRLAAELRMLLTEQRDDAIQDRLFPSAYESPRDEAAYRELTSDDLLRYKLDAIDAVSAGLGSTRTEVVLNDEALDQWLACLTDIRLAIGTKLDVDEERMAADIDPNDPDAQPLAVLHWLGWVQEGILREL